MFLAKIRQHSRRQRFLAKLVCISGLAVLLTVILVVGLLSSFFRRSALEDLKRNQIYVTEQYAALFADLHQTANMAASILLGSADVASALDGTASHPYEAYLVNQQVRGVLTQYPFLHSVSLVNVKGAFLYNTHLHAGAFLDSDLAHYFKEDAPPNYYRFLSRQVPVGQGEDEAVISMVIPYRYVEGAPRRDGRRPMASGIVINISAGHFFSAVEGGAGAGNGILLVLNGDDVLCASAPFSPDAYRQSHASLQALARKGEGAADIELDGQRYLAAYSGDAFYTVANLTGYDQIFRNTNILTAQILSICLGISLAALVAIFLMIRRTYRPLGHMVSSMVEHSGEPFFSSGDEVDFVRKKYGELRAGMEKASRQLTQSEPYIKQQLIVNLLQGHASRRNLQMLRDYFPGLWGHAAYQVILLKLSPRAGEETGAAMRWEVQRLLSEQLEGRHFIVFEESRSRLVVICGLVHPAGAVEKDALAQLQGKLPALHLTVCIGIPTGALEVLSRSYDSACGLLSARFVLGLDAVIGQDDVAALGTSAFPIQSNLDKLQKALKSADQVGLVNEINILFGMIGGCCYDLAMLMINALLYHIIEVANQLLRAESGDSNSLNVNNLHLNLTRLQTVEEVKQYLTTIGIALIEKIEKSRDSYKYTLFESILAFIDENLCDSGLSLDMIGESLGFSSGYVGKVFNTFRPCGVAEYINQSRVEQAKVRLLETQDTIASISKAMGFQSSGYFITIFKKHVGTTPNSYRKAAKANFGDSRAG